MNIYTWLAIVYGHVTDFVATIQGGDEAKMRDLFKNLLDLLSVSELNPTYEKFGNPTDGMMYNDFIAEKLLGSSRDKEKTAEGERLAKLVAEKLDAGGGPHLLKELTSLF